MQLTQWMRRFWDENRNRRARRAAEARSGHCAGEYVSLRLTRLDDRRVFSVASVTAGVDASVSEGAVYALPASTYTDATAAVSPHTAEVDWGDGSAIQALTVSSEPASLGANGTVAGANHTFADNGVYNVVVTVRGSDGSSRSDTVQVTVNNVNPIALAGGPYRVAVGGTVQLSGSGLDAGINDTLTYVWDLNGNGVFGETGAAATRGDETGQTPTFNAAGLAAGSVSSVTLRVIDKDGGNGTQSVNVTVNTPPSVTSSGSTNFTEDGPSVQINSGLTVTDANNDNITSATVTIGGFRAGDVLTWTNNPNIVGNYDNNTGILTFTGARAASEYQSLLQSVRYDSTSDAPGTTRTISFTTSDAFNTSTIGTRSIAITELNDAPTVTTSAGTVTYVEGAAAISIDGNITVVDPDNATLASATIQISLNYQQGQDLLEYTAGGPFTVNWNAIVGRLTLTNNGAATAADFQAALRSVTYRNTSQNPNTAVTRTITFTVNDGTTNGSDSRDLQVTAVNNAPEVTTSGGNTAYTENGAGVAIDNSLTVADPDNTNLASATVQITGGYVAGDVLAYSGPNFTASWDLPTRTLTLTPTASRTVAQYQAALRLVTFASTSNSPGSGNRTISFVVGDGTDLSTAATKTVAVTATNDAPTIAVPAATQTTAEDTPLVFSGVTLISVDDVDAGTNDVEVTLAMTLGTLKLSGTTGLTFNQGADNTNQMRFRGTLAEVNAALDGLRFDPGQNLNGPAVLTITISDLGNSGSGGALTATDTVNITVTAVNDAPTINAGAGTTSYTEQATAVPIAPTLTVADVDNANLASATVEITGGYVVGDVLGYSGPNFNASWNPGNQTLTLTPTGTRTVAQYQAALRLVTFSSNSNNPGSGNRTIEFVVGDGTDLSAPATKTVAVTPVNDAPTITGAGQTVGHIEGGADTAVGPLLVVSDPDSTNLTSATVQIVNFSSTQDVLEYTGAGPFSAVFSGGTLTLTATGAATAADFQAALRSVVYRNTVDAPVTTNRTIRFRVSDGALQSNAVDNTLTITATNDPPSITVPGQQTTPGQTTLTFNAANGNAITISDPDAGSGQVRVTLTAGTGGIITGRLTLNSTSGLTFSTGDGANDTTMTFTGTIANVNAALNGLRYTPDNRVNGLTGIDISVNDQGNSPGGTPAALTATATAVIEVSPTNDPPTITVPGTQTTAEDTSLVFSGATLISVDDEDAANFDVEVTLAVTLGTLKLSGTAGLNFNQGADNTSQMRFRGTLAEVNAALDGLRFNPGQDLNGTAVLSISINDLGNIGTGGAQTATATVNIDITPVNDAPTLNVGAGSTSYTEQAPPVAVAPILTVADIDSTNLSSATVRITGGFVTGDELAYSGPNFTATWDVPTRTLTLTPTAPRTVAEYQAALRLVTFAGTSDDPGASRTIQFQVTDPDGAVSTLTNAVKSVTITQVNDPPVLPPIADIQLAQGAAIPDIVVTVSDPDTPIGNLTLTATNTTNALLIPLANISITANGAQRTISLTPILNVFGETTITLTLSDGAGGTATRTFKVLVNNPPTITPPADVDTDEDGGDRSVTFTVNDTETPQDNLVVSVVSSSDNLLVPVADMRLTYNGAGNYTLTMSFGADRNGTSVVRLRVFDGEREAFAEFNVVVRPVNDPPTANDLTVTTDEDTDVTRTLTGADGDGGIQTLTYRISAGPQNGIITSFNAATGQFTYRPNANYSGQDTFQFIVTDDGLAGPPAALDSIAAGTVTITVTPVADSPTITVSSPSGTVVGNENTRITSTIIVQLADADGSEQLGDIFLENVQPGLRIFAPDGTEYAQIAPGTYRFTPAQFTTIRFYAPDDLDTTFTVRTSSLETLRPASTAAADRLVRLQVLNTPPVITGFTGTDVDANSLSTVNGSISDAPLDRFSVTIRWGVSTVGFSQLTSLNNLGPGLANFIASNQFLIAPDPANPAAPISIILDVADNNGGTATQTIIVRVPGTGIPTVNIRESGIQVSQLPIATYIAPQNTDARPYTVAVQPSGDTGRVIVDRVAVTTRSVLLRVVSARGVESADTFRLGANVLSDIPSFLRKLPDGHYRLYLSENEFTPDRLLIDVVVFRGRAVSLGDMQADRPPLQEVAAVPQRSAPANAPPKNTSAEVRGDAVVNDGARFDSVPPAAGPVTEGSDLSGPALNSGSSVSGEPSR